MCNKHKKYKGKQRPRNGCLGCWKVWLEWNQEEEIKAGDLFEIFNGIDKYMKEEIANLDSKKANFIDPIYGD